MNTFEHQQFGTSVRKDLRVVQHRLSRLILAPLNLERTELVYELRLQAEVRADRHTAHGQIFDDAGLLATTFELDHLCPAPLHQPLRSIEIGRTAATERGCQYG